MKKNLQMALNLLRKPDRMERLSNYIAFRWRRHLECRRLRVKGPEMLRRIHNALEGSGIGYYADFGTLLGAVRNGSFIRHDDDLDFTLRPGFSSPLRLIDSLEKNGVPFHKAFAWEGRLTELVFDMDGLHADFFYSFPSGAEGEVYTQFYTRFENSPQGWKGTEGFRLFKRDAKGVETAKISGAPLEIPANAEEVLAGDYGKTWRVPAKNFKASDATELRRDRIIGDAPELFGRAAVENFLASRR